MLPADQIHFVANTGYFHKPNQDCPPNEELRDALHCQCSPRSDFTWHKYSCVHKFFHLQKMVRPDTLEHISMIYPTIYDTIMNAKDWLTFRRKSSDISEFQQKLNKRRYIKKERE